MCLIGSFVVCRDILKGVFSARRVVLLRCTFWVVKSKNKLTREALGRVLC